MIDKTGSPESATTWERDIRALEEEGRIAFLAADVQTLSRLWADGLVVNSPLQKVLAKREVLDLLQAGRIRHTAYEIEIETMTRHGDVAIVMGRDTVADPPDGAISRRRFTNVWRLENGAWRTIARHAHVASREAAG
ncbi:MAG TPA: nuclear transport factor 2 family protein [Candidatus Eisenbacteria bacterium]|nr:nuclear transport factor 2 family protein [Candidatus Eisenbacteria bacterium]